jgi:hypothetical protein
MRTHTIIGILALSLLGVSVRGQTTSQDQGADLKPNQSVKLTLQGYVRDLACLMKFNEALKPTNDCAVMCARTESPLVIVTREGTIYTPISDSIPDTSQPATLGALAMGAPGLSIWKREESVGAGK